MTEIHTGHGPLGARERIDTEKTGTSAGEMAAGAVAVLFGILGLTGIAPAAMGAIAALCIGGAILFGRGGQPLPRKKSSKVALLGANVLVSCWKPPMAIFMVAKSRSDAVGKLQVYQALFTCRPLRPIT